MSSHGGLSPRRTHWLRQDRLGWWRALVVGLLILLPSYTPATASIRLPEGFVIEEIFPPSVLTTPTDFEFLPDGSILVAEKGRGSEMGTADIYLIEQPGETAVLTSVLGLPTNPQGDSGVLGLILDPNFAENRYFYVWYSTRGTAFEFEHGGTSHYRLSRFTLDPTTKTADPASEQIILDDIPRAHYHNGGGMAFDNAGNLYLATGDTWTLIWEPHFSQAPQNLLGKVLRIRPTEQGYAVPDDNPFVDNPAYRPEIYALGTRNPFRMTQRQQDDTIVFGDVGFVHWEELDKVAAGANYGWPQREGPCPRGQYLPCPAASEAETDPFGYYPHPEGVGCCSGGAVAGMAFYEGQTFPAEYHNQLFMADFNHQFIAAVDLDVGLIEAPYFAENVGSIVDMAYHDEALYLLDIVRGTISRIYYAGDNTPPQATITADSTFGVPPHPITFSATLANDHGGNYRYLWHFDDATPPQETTEATVTHTYTQDGRFLAQLTVTDENGRSSTPVSLPITIYSGEIAQIGLTNLTDSERSLFYGGDQFRYKAVRDSGLADLDPTTPYTWRVDLLHNFHVHPLLVDNPGQNGLLTVPVHNHGDVNIAYRLTLTMHTENGLALTTSQTLEPALTEPTIAIAPNNLNVFAEINGTPQQLPHAFQAIVNVEQSLVFPQTVLQDRAVYDLQQWNGAETETAVIFQPTTDQTDYIVEYELTRPAHLSFLPLLKRLGQG